MSQETDPSEYHSRSRTTDPERDHSSDSEADSHRPDPPPQPRLRVRATARKSVPLPTRVTFRVPARDEAGPSRARSRSRSSSSSSSPPPYRPSSPVAPVVRPPPAVQPPPAVRPPPAVLRLSGMTPGERGEVARIARGQRLHRSLILHHDHTIDALIATAGAESQQMNQIVALLGHTMDSLSHLYAVVYMVMALAVVAFGSIWWSRT